MAPVPMAPLAALNVVLLWPAEMVAVAGTVSAATLLESVTATELSAGCVMDKVQTEEALLPRLLGVQLSELNCTEAARVIVAVRFCPFSVAVTVAVSLVLIVVALAENVAVLDPTAMVTLAGTWRLALLLARVTVVATPALRSRDAVQVDD